MKKIFVLILLAVLLVGTISAFEFDNRLSYSNNDVKVTIKNSIFGLIPTSEIGTAELKSHPSVNYVKKVGAGNQVVMWYDFEFNELYENGLGEVYFTDIKTGKLIERDYSFVYWGEKERDVYGCEYSFSANGTKVCNSVVVGKETYETWLPYDSKDIPKGNIRIGLMTYVEVKDKVDGVWTIAGKKLKKHAVWTASLNVDLISLWEFGESAGTNASDSYDGHHGTTQNMEDGDWIVGKINNALDFGGTNEYVNVGTMGTLGSAMDNPFAVSLWINTTSTTRGAIMGTWNTGETNTVFRINMNHPAAGKIELTMRDEDGDLFVASTTNDIGFNNGSWRQVVMVIDAPSNSLTLYLDNVSKAVTASTSGSPSNFIDFDYALYIAAENVRGALTRVGVMQLDEIGIWNRSLSVAEVSQLWNDGNGLPYGIPGLNITLLSPEDEATFTTNNINLSANISDSGGVGIANVTINAQHSNGTIMFSETNTSGVEGLYNFTNSFGIGDYNWSITAYDDADESYESDTRSFSYLAFEVDEESHESEVLETARQEFEINVTSSEGYTISNGRLVYNGTAYENADKISIDSDSFQLIHTINIPSGTAGFGSENRTFYWNISVTNEDTGSTTAFTTDDYNQTVNELVFQLCGGAATEPVLNFTMFDEETGDGINTTANPSTFQATFNLGADYLNLNKNYSINNASVDTNEFDFCTSNSSDFFYVDMESFYTAANYVNKNYFLNNASLNESATAEISLYLLNESNALEFFISVEQDLSPITEATINIKKFFVGEGVYKTVEIDETSSDTGEFTAYLSLDGGYTFTISKNGIVLGTVTKTAYCKQAPCELTLSLRSGLADIYEQFSAFFGQNVNYNLVWNPNTKIVIFDFIDTTGLANYFRMKIWKGNYNTASDLVFDKTLYTSSGTITANMSNYTDGDFTTWVYVSRSPELPIDFIKFAMKEVIGKFGLLGLFFAFLLIVTIIFGLSFSPPILVFSIPLALTISTFMGISLLSGTGIVIIYILAVIAAFAMKGQ